MGVSHHGVRGLVAKLTGEMKYKLNCFVLIRCFDGTATPATLACKFINVAMSLVAYLLLFSVTNDDV
jgi:hypothetical protein